MCLICLITTLIIKALETYLSTARQPKNIKGILENYNYKIEPVGSARGEITIALKNVGEDAPYTPVGVLIPRYTRVTTVLEPFIEYITTEDCMIGFNEIQTKVGVVQGIREVLSLKTSELKN